MNQTAEIRRLVAEKRIKEAIALLYDAARAANLPETLSVIEGAEQTYAYMLRYLADGVPDPSREQMHGRVSETLLSVADRIDHDLRLRDDPSLYFSSVRLLRLRPVKLETLLQRYRDAGSLLMLTESEADPTTYNPDTHRAQEEALADIFKYVWTRYPLTKGDAELISKLLKEGSYELTSQLVSALMLSAMEWYDREKILLLLNAYSDDGDSGRLSARLLVALLLLSARHAERIASDRDLMVRMETWQDSLITYQRLNLLLMAYLKTRDTDRIINKMRDEVIPRLQEIQPEIMKRMKDGQTDIPFDPEANPEWQELLDKNGLSEKLMELQEMQRDGADVMMAPFSNLKSFPFFHEISNWFLPFRSDHSQLSAWRAMNSDILASIVESDALSCDSDSYSFALSMSQMPEAQRQAMSSQLQEMAAQMNEDLNSQLKRSSHPDFDREAARSLRDLFRFYRLFRGKKDFTDPFSSPIDFNKLPGIGLLLSDADTRRLVAEFYFSRGYHKEAAPLFEALAKEFSDEPQLLEKLGYCLQLTGDLQGAYEAYTKAELLSPDSKWLTRKLAFVCRRLGRYREAADYYRKALENDSENPSLLINLGHVLVETGALKEALKAYYKAEYLRPGHGDTLRAIAWTELLDGNTSRAREHYAKLTENTPTAADNLNAAHAALVAGDFQAAVGLYRRAFAEDEKMRQAFMDDAATLERLGVSRTLLAMTMDILNQK